MRLHSAPRSGNSYKVRLLLALLGRRCEIVDYDTKGGETHIPKFVENVNPDGKVPVLELKDGTMLPESGAILLYLAEDTPYLPEGKLERAQVLRWMFFEQYSLLLYLSRPRLWRMWGVEITPQREAELEQFFEQGYKALGVMERHLGNCEFFVGDRPTVADVALYVYPSLAHEGGFDLEQYPAVRAWLNRIAALPGYVPLNRLVSRVPVTSEFNKKEESEGWEQWLARVPRARRKRSGARGSNGGEYRSCGPNLFRVV